MSTIHPNTIIRGWNGVEQGAGRAIDWIASVRQDAPRLNTEADRLTMNLRRSRNKSTQIGAGRSETDDNRLLWLVAGRQIVSHFRAGCG